MKKRDTTSGNSSVSKECRSNNPGLSTSSAFFLKLDDREDSGGVEGSDPSSLALLCTPLPILELYKPNSCTQIQTTTNVKYNARIGSEENSQDTNKELSPAPPAKQEL